MPQQRVSKPGFNEIVTLILLLALMSLPILVLFITSGSVALIFFVFLAVSFWFPVGQVIHLAVCGYRRDGTLEWPRIVGGPSVRLNHRPPGRL